MRAGQRRQRSRKSADPCRGRPQRPVPASTVLACGMHRSFANSSLASGCIASHPTSHCIASEKDRGVAACSAVCAVHARGCAAAAPGGGPATEQGFTACDCALALAVKAAFGKGDMQPAVARCAPPSIAVTPRSAPHGGAGVFGCAAVSLPDMRGRVLLRDGARVCRPGTRATSFSKQTHGQHEQLLCVGRAHGRPCSRMGCAAHVRVSQHNELGGCVAAARIAATV